jgi:hypothetical protein
MQYPLRFALPAALCLAASFWLFSAAQSTDLEQCQQKQESACLCRKRKKRQVAQVAQVALFSQSITCQNINIYNI